MKGISLFKGSLIGCILLSLFFAINSVNSQCVDPSPNEFTFFLRYDYYYSESSWVLSDASSGVSQSLTTTFQNYTYYGSISQTGCLADGCYNFTLYDSYGDGIIYLPGYYLLSLNGEYITLGGKQTFDGLKTSMYFCTSLFNESTNEMSLDLTITDYNSEISIYDDNNKRLYYENYENYGDSNPNSLMINSGCYTIKFNNGNQDVSTGSYSLDIQGYTFIDSSSAVSNEISFCYFDEIFEFSVNSGVYEDKQTLKCDTAGCNVNGQWIIDGYCINPVLNIQVIETDYSYYSENLTLFVNNHEIGTCEPLNQDCTFDLINCTSATDLDISDYVEYSDSTTYISIELDAMDEINVCPYNGSYVYSYVTISCDNLDGMVTFDVSTDDDKSISKKFGCDSYGCSATQLFLIDGISECSNPLLTVKVYENDYADTYYEYAYIYVNDYNLGSCETLDEDCDFTYYDCDIVTCDIANSINLNDYLENVAGNDSDWAIVNVTIDASIDVNFNPIYKNNTYYYVYGEATISCIDYIFTVGDNDEYSTSEEVSCSSTGCDIEASWQIDGKCLRPKLFIDIMETDFSYYTEYVTMYVNGDNIGTCEPLNEDCTYTMVRCNITDNGGYDISSYIDNRYQDSKSELTITLDSADEVNVCDYNGKYLYGFINITCDNVGPTSAPTMQPTMMPTDYNCTAIEGSDSNTDILAFDVHLDYWYYEVAWIFYDVTNNDEIVMSGNGTQGGGSYGIVNDRECVNKDNCYFMYLSDGYGDGMYRYGDYGYYQIFYGNNELTFGKQAEIGYYGTFYFCANNFNDGSHNFTIILSNDNNVTYFKIFSAVDENGNGGLTKIYDNYYIVQEYYAYYDANGLTTQSFMLTDGCYMFNSTNDFDLIYTNDLNENVNEIPVANGEGFETSIICVSTVTTSNPTTTETVSTTEEQGQEPDTTSETTEEDGNGGEGNGDGNSQSNSSSSTEISDWMGTPIGTMITIGVGFLLFAVLLLCCYHFVLRKKRDKSPGEQSIAEMADLPSETGANSAYNNSNDHPTDPLGRINRVDTSGQLPNLQATSFQTSEGGHGMAGMNNGTMNTMGTMGPMNNMSPQQMQLQLAMMQRMHQQMMQQTPNYQPPPMNNNMNMMNMNGNMAGMGMNGMNGMNGMGMNMPGMHLPAAPQIQQTPGLTPGDEQDNEDDDGPGSAAPPAFGGGGGGSGGMAMSIALSQGGETNDMMQTTGSHGGHVGEANSHLSGWQSWDFSKVAQWLSFELMNNYGLDSAEEQEQVGKFIEEFKSQKINGKMLQKIKNDKNNEYLKFIKENFTDQSAGLWIGVKDAVSDLPDE